MLSHQHNTEGNLSKNSIVLGFEVDDFENLNKTAINVNIKFWISLKVTLSLSLNNGYGTCFQSGTW